ncbi:MAG: RNA polymerase sigma-70 factor (ECF subfamily) [Alphaproteobacteria bacterium]|jgi:RNA polymerase sigma-70 factor (ECF subfamily)
MGSDFYTMSILPYAPIIVKICRAYTNTQSDFEDYYQEVCLQIWRSQDSFSVNAQWSTWVYKISLNVCLTYLKKSKNNSLASDPLPDEVITDSQISTEHAIEQLYAGIRQLSELDRAIILLYLEETPYQEISDIIGTTPNNIGVRIARIKTRLNKILKLEDN